MVSILVRLILCGVLVCGVVGCSALNQLTTAPPQGERKVVEEDVADDARGGQSSTPEPAPGITEQPPAPPVEEPGQVASPAERPKRTIRWDNRREAVTGESGKDSSRP